MARRQGSIIYFTSAKAAKVDVGWQAKHVGSVHFAGWYGDWSLQRANRSLQAGMQPNLKPGREFLSRASGRNRKNFCAV
jgi:hypothetical protein